MQQLNLWAQIIWLSPLKTLFYSFIFFSLVSNEKCLKGFEILPHPSHSHLALHMLKPRRLLEGKEVKEVRRRRSGTQKHDGRIEQGSQASQPSIAPWDPRKCSNSKSAVLEYTTSGTSVGFLFQTTKCSFLWQLWISKLSHTSWQL